VTICPARKMALIRAHYKEDFKRLLLVKTIQVPEPLVRRLSLSDYNDSRDSLCPPKPEMSPECILDNENGEVRTQEDKEKYDREKENAKKHRINEIK